MKAHKIAVSVAFVLLTVWLLIGGWQSSRHQPTKTQANYAPQQIQTNHKPDPFSWDWLTHDGVVFFTCVLAFIAGIQAFLFLWQLILIKRTLGPAKEAAEAAQAAAEHIPIVERAYVSGGAVSIAGDPHHFIVTINNYGKTPAFIGTIWAAIDPESTLPTVPDYEPYWGWFGGQVLKPDTPGLNSGVARLWDGIEGRVIYGRIWYRDIFKSCHSAGFILRILGPGMTVAVENRDAYWEDRDECDLGPAARPPHGGQRRPVPNRRG